MNDQSLRIENWELRNGSLTEPPGGYADPNRSSMVQFQILNSQFSIPLLP